jgi:hypothetical protein
MDEERMICLYQNLKRSYEKGKSSCFREQICGTEAFGSIHGMKNRNTSLISFCLDTQKNINWQNLKPLISFGASPREVSI